MDDLIPKLRAVDPTSSDALRLGLKASLRTPKASIESITTPLDISSINWRAVDARELMDAIGIAYAQDRMRVKRQRKINRAEDRAIESMLKRSPKQANQNRKRVVRGRRMAIDGLFRDAAEILGMKNKNLY
jgi:hypothetical protein